MCRLEQAEDERGEEGNVVIVFVCSCAGGSNNFGQLDVPHQPGTCVDAAGKSTGVACKSSADCATGLCSGPRKYDWVQVSAGRQNTCAVDKSNTVYCWGSNSFGQTAAPGSNLYQTGWVLML
eukprot:759187-Hanusia_phi.AAC.5